MGQRKDVLCVVSEEQYQEYEPEFAMLKKVDAEIRLETSPQLGLAMIEQLKPVAVFVGMQINGTEGIEFIALLLKRYPNFDKPVIVLPDKEDDMPPMVHCRGGAGGRSSVDGSNFEQITKMIAEAEGVISDAPGSVVPVAPPGSAIAEDITETLERSTPEPMREDSSVPPVPPGDSVRSSAFDTGASPGAKKSRLIAIAVAAVVVLAGAVVAFVVLSGGDGEPEPTRKADAPKVETKPAEPQEPAMAAVSGENAAEPVEEPPTPPEDPGVASGGDNAPPVKESPGEAIEPTSPTGGADSSGQIALPLSFQRGDSSPTVTDREELTRIVNMLKENESRIAIAGHTSADGDTVNNLQLGIQRAKNAMAALVKRGISPERFEITSRGERDPLAPNETEDGRRQNRRVTITLGE